MSIQQRLWPKLAFVCAMTLAIGGLSACGGNGTTAAAPNAAIAGAVVDGRVSGATLTLYSDQAMTVQVGTGTTDAVGAFNITLTVATAPDPIYIKAVGGTDLDTGMPAPTMLFVGNTTGANALATFNITPLTNDVFTRVANGSTLATAQTNSQAAFGLAANTGANGLYEDPSLAGNAGLPAAVFKKLTAGTVGGTVAAGTYKMFAITASEADIGVTAIANTAALTGGANFVSGDVVVAANGDVTGTTGANFITGKVVGSSVILNIVDNVAAPTAITRVVGSLGLNGSMSGNFSNLTGLPGAPVMKKGLYVGSLIPAAGINAAGLATFVSNFYTPGVGTGTMNIVARDIFIGAGVPRVNWGQADVTAVNVGAGTVTMSNMNLMQDAGSVAGGVNAFTFAAGTYVLSGAIPTNLLVFEYTTVGAKLYIVTSVGLRRGIYFVVPTVPGTIQAIGESYMSKQNSVVPNPFAVGMTADITIGSIHAGMPGGTRAAALTQGFTPQVAGPMTLPGALTAGTIGNGYLNAPTELMVFQGSMLAMKMDANNNFADNIMTGAVDDHLRLVEFFESGAMQGEEIQGGALPGPITLRDYPSTFVGFVHDQASAVTPGFSGTLNFLARTVYASSYASFAGAYTTGTLTITAPTATAGTATLVATPAGGAVATSTLTVDVPAAGAPGVYHMSGALTGAGYIDITWPIGGTKALYMISTAVGGTVSEVGEAYITQ